MDKNIGKNRSENLSSKYGQNFLDHVKESTTTDSLKTVSKMATLKTVIWLLIKLQKSQELHQLKMCGSKKSRFVKEKETSGLLLEPN